MGIFIGSVLPSRATDGSGELNEVAEMHPPGPAEGAYTLAGLPKATGRI